jgi:hypothetical protein
MIDFKVFKQVGENLEKFINDRIGQLAAEYFESNENLATALLAETDLQGVNVLYVFPGERGQLLSSIINSGNFTGEHVDFVAACLMFEAVRKAYSCSLDDVELFKQNAEVNPLYDRIEQLIPEENFSDNYVFSEQEYLRGKIAYERFRKLRREGNVLNNLSTDSERKHLEQAAAHFQKAYDLGRTTDSMLIARLGYAYKWLADLAGYDTEEGKQYAQKSLEAYGRELENAHDSFSAEMAKDSIGKVKRKLEAAEK